MSFNGDAREYFGFKKNLWIKIYGNIKVNLLEQRYALPRQNSPMITYRLSTNQYLTAEDQRSADSVEKWNREVDSKAQEAKSILLGMLGPIVYSAIVHHFPDGPNSGISPRNQFVNAIQALETTYGQPPPTVSQTIIAELHALPVAETADQARVLVAQMQTLFAELRNFPIHHHETPNVSINRLFVKLGSAFMISKRDINALLQNPACTREAAFEIVIADCRIMAPSPATVPRGASPWTLQSATPSSQPTAILSPQSSTSASVYRAAPTQTEEDAYQRGLDAGYRKRQREEKLEASTGSQAPISRPSPSAFRPPTGRGPSAGRGRGQETLHQQRGREFSQPRKSAPVFAAAHQESAEEYEDAEEQGHEEEFG